LVLLPLVLTIGLVAIAREGESTTPVLGIRANDVNWSVFVNATIVASPERTIEDAVLVVRNGLVVDVCPGAPVPDGAARYDLQGKWIYPGFIDPYTAYGLPRERTEAPTRSRRGRPQYEGQRVGANAWNDAVHAETNWVDRFSPDEEAASSLRKRGFTTVQAAKLDGIFRGRAFVTSLGRGLPNDLVLEPYGLHFASFDKGTSKQSYPSSLMGSIALVRQTLLDADWYRRAREAYAKSAGGPAPEFNRAVAALADYDGAILFKTGDNLSLLRAARISSEFSIPLVHVGSNDEYARIEAIAALDQPIILPVDFPDPPDVASYESALGVDLVELRQWERAPWNPATLEDHDVRFAFTAHGLDPGSDYLGQVREAVRRGLGAGTALAALTTVPAELTGVAELVGTLEVGKRADFSIADGDLLADDEARIHSVWIAGEQAEEIVALDQTDFRGEYDIRFGGATYELGIAGAIDKLEGEVRLGDDTTKLNKIEGGRSALRFSADLDRVGGEGVARFSWVEMTRGSRGTVALSDGRLVAFEVERVDRASDEPAEEGSSGDDDRKKADRESPELVSRLTYPNVAFGFEQSPQPEDVLIRNATLWTNEADGILEGADLLVRDGRIAAVGRQLSAPGGVRIIDATGKHVAPGIIDEHSHIAISRGGNEGSHAVTAEVRVGDILNSKDVNIYRALAGGVTAAQILHGSANPIGGQAQVIKLRWGALPEGLKFDAAPPTIKFALGENVKHSNRGPEFTTRYPQTRMGVETLIRDSLLAARDYEQAWKGYRDLSSRERERTVPPRRDLQLEALLEILNRRRFVHCHSYVQSEILMLMRLAEELDFRVQTFTHILEGYKVAPEMAAHGAGGSSFADWWAYKFEVYDAIPYNTCLMHAAGVVTSINSDSSDYGRRLNQEASKSVMYCGMAQEQALKLATLNPAIQLRIDDRVGSLAVGKDADFAVWSGNPLSVFSKVEQTWVEGTPYFDVERDRRLYEDAQDERETLVQKALRADKKGDGKRRRAGREEDLPWSCQDDWTDVDDE
jgi:imidazolonepropionase-like amidohydrolase